MIYMDNAATTRMYPEVFEAMKPWLTDKYGNPSAEYPMGREAREAVERAREDIAATLDTTPEHIIFTSGGSEGNALVLCGAEDMAFAVGSTIEHPSVKNNVLEEFLKPESNGKITRYAFDPDFSKWPVRPSGISVMWVNNETGTANDIIGLSTDAHGWGVSIHTDAVQGYGAYDARTICGCVDYMTASAHKFHGPKGVGFVYAKHPEKLTPLIKGGGQERGFRSGTENVAAIVGMAAAAKIADVRIQTGCFMWLKHDYADRIREGLAPVADRFNGDSRKVVSVTLKDVSASTMVLALGEQGICVSAGSACHANSDKPSHVLKAMGLADDEARRTIRISLGDDTLPSEVDALIKTVCSTVETLRGGI